MHESPKTAVDWSYNWLVFRGFSYLHTIQRFVSIPHTHAFCIYPMLMRYKCLMRETNVTNLEQSAKAGQNALHNYIKLGRDSRFFAANEAYRSRVTARSRLRLRWKHTVLSTLSKLSESKCIRALRFKRSCKSIRSPPMVIHRMKKKNRESRWWKSRKSFRYSEGLMYFSTSNKRGA